MKCRDKGLFNVHFNISDPVYKHGLHSSPKEATFQATFLKATHDLIMSFPA
jgi:hypothetical protein